MSYGTPVSTCVLYARLSVTNEESVSIERQLESCRKYAEARGWEVIGEFVDDGVSATANKPEDRKGWGELLRSSGFDAVVIWKVDRLARRVLDFLHADEALRGLNAGLVAVEDPIDMTSPQGRAFAVMLAVFGEMEAEAIRARVRAARSHLISVGRWTGGGVPFGYQPIDNPDGPGRILVKAPDQIEWLAKIVEMALAGSTVSAITTWLTEQRVPVPRARKSGSKVWNRQTVEGLLRNPTLAGMTPYNPGRGRQGQSGGPFGVLRDENDDPVVAERLAVITVEQFRELQHLLDSRDAPQARPRAERQATSPFLSKVARCDDCDVYLCRGTNQGKATLYCPVCRQTISREHLDAWLIKRLLRVRGGEPFVDSTLKERWRTSRSETERRDLLVSQIESLRIRRGKVGARFDSSRVLLEWKATADPLTGAAS